VHGLAGERFAVRAHFDPVVHVLARDAELECLLPPLSAEIFTIVPIDHGIAPLGLVDLFNSAGAIQDKSWVSPECYRLQLRGPGRFVAYCERISTRVS
jgi:hypothetical protein